MSKDPAFLFYSKDWIEGTAELMPEEKGVLIDLLAQQHQSKDLPNDTRRLARIARLSHEDFLKIWAVIAKMFKPNGERLVNRMLSEVMGERSDKGHKNKIIGTFASLLRLRPESDKLKKIVKSRFNVNDFTEIESELITERLTEWFNGCLKSIGNGDANEDGGKNGSTGKKETGKKVIVFPWDSEIFSKTWAIWKSYRKEEHSFFYKKETSEQAALMSLANISKGIEEDAIKIIEQSMSNGWKGFFELKHNSNNGTTKKPGTSISAEQAHGLFNSMYPENGSGQT